MASPLESKSPGGRGAHPAPTRNPGKKSTSPQSAPTLQEVKKRGHRIRKTPERDICDQLEGLRLDRDTPALGTGLVWDDRMTIPHCLWDDNFPECPARLLAVKEKLTQYNLVTRCVPIPAREASVEELQLVHSSEYVALMESTQHMTEEELRLLSDRYDSVYLHPASFSTACLAAGSVLQLVDKVVKKEIRNGLAAVRPPGHHAHTDQMNGYCMFNQLAIAARHLQRHHGIRRVLIVDWDVHHGQGTQFIFEHDPSVLYFSIHRHEDGQFWPHLAESCSTAVGKDRGERYNINVPWNKTGMKDADYITAFLHLLLPVAYEFQPQFVLVAAGFDSVVGDPKGEMAATPACFAQLTHLLMSLAEGRLVLALEGGYNLRSLAEGICASLKVLLGDPCPHLAQPFAPCESALDSISGAIRVHRQYWRSLQEQDFTLKQENKTDSQGNCDASQADTSEDSLSSTLDAVMKEVMRKIPEQRTGLVYDERMMEHYNLWDSGHPEVPQRISRIFLRHRELGLLDRCLRLSPRMATKDELRMCHSLPYIKRIEGSAHMKPRDLHRTAAEYNSIYIHNKSYNCACLAAGATFSVVEAVVTGKVQNGVCIVRPPGHHAEPGAACGFCFFNNVALAARYAQSLQSPSDPPFRVMILDWDIHHGNGIQHIFQDDDSVLYVSIHRYDDGLFFPSSEDAAHEQVGRGGGEGFNVNIPWNGGKMGDIEYLLAFHRIVMPIAYEFNPQLVLISAGFDAARGDPLGGCRVTPEGYAHMTHLLMGLAGGKVVAVLEGGYNLTSISESMAMCTRMLLGEPPPFLSDLYPPRPSALQTISNVLSVQHKYWRSLRLKVEPPPPSELPKVNLSPQKLQSSKVAFVESPPSPKLTPISPREGIVGTQSPPKIDFSGPNAAAGSLIRLTPSSEIMQERSLLPVAFRNESTDISRIDSSSITYSVEESMEGSSLDNNDAKDHVTEFPPQTDGACRVEETSVNKDDGLNLHVTEYPPQTDGACRVEETLVNKDDALNLRVMEFPPQANEAGRVEETSGNKDGALILHATELATTAERGELGAEEEAAGQLSMLNSSSEGDALELVIEVQVLDKTPNKHMSGDKAESAVEKLFRDLKLEDHHQTSSTSIMDSVSGPAGCKRSIPSFESNAEGAFSVGARLDDSFLSEAAGGCRVITDLEPAPEFYGDLFPVTPLSWCPHLESVCELPSCGLDVAQPCAACGTDVETWVCLSCYVVLCGRYVCQHMMYHGVSSGHNLVLSFSDLSVWCYGCDAYIHNEVLMPAKQSAYYSKFGEEFPGA